VISALAKKIDALDDWCLRRILHIQSTGRILSLTLFSLVQVSHSCQILSVDGVCFSLATFVVPTPVKNILELFSPAKDWRHRTGRLRQTWLRTVEDDHFSISAWRRQGGGLWIERHRVNS